LWGASGFTGKLIAEYFLKEYGLNKSLRWAMAGRDKKKIERLRLELKYIDKDSVNIPILIGDSNNIDSLNTIVKQTNVICTTVGPYLNYGKLLVKACIDQKTDYCDITGEVPFIRDSIEAYHEIAKEKNIKIVHCCGYDSIPSDLGCLMVQDYSIQTQKTPCSKVVFYAGKTRGGFSGGTIASMINISEKSKFDKKMRKVLLDPYALNINEGWRGKDDLGQRNIQWDSNLDLWTGPFIMAMINTKVVRRTNELINLKYGKDFSYHEVMTFPSGIFNRLRAELFRLGLGFFGIALRIKFFRFFLKKFILPSPGKGPSRAERENGYFNITLLGKGRKEDGNTYKIKGFVYGDKDPGYAGTARMLGESAICLALNKKDLPKIYGILTPASGIGKILINKLIDKGMKFDVGIIE